MLYVMLCYVIMLCYVMLWYVMVCYVCFLPFQYSADCAMVTNDMAMGVADVTVSVIGCMCAMNES